MTEIRVNFSEQQIGYLHRLVGSGIWGESMEETVKQIVLDCLKETIGRGELLRAQRSPSDVSEGVNHD